MKVAKLMRGQYLLVLGLAVAVCPWVYAAGSGGPANGLAARLVCESFTQMSGPLGLFIGFSIALYGLWQIIVSAELKTGLLFIVVGALLTALPGVVRTFLEAGSDLMRATGISDVSIVGAMNNALNYQGRCDTIPVDLADFDANNPAFYLSPGKDAQGRPLPSPFASGRPNVGGTVSGGRAGVFPSDASNMTGQNPGGCLHLVEGNSGNTSGFGRRNGTNHNGVDIGCGGRIGLNIRASRAGGTIIRAYESMSYGNRLEVDVGGGVVHTYSHLSGFAPTARVGAPAPAIVGYCGNTGRSRGAHLHFEIRINNKYVDPVQNGC